MSNIGNQKSKLRRKANLLALATSALLALGAARALALDPRQPLSRYFYEVWQARDGLPAGSINSIAQSPDGYLWLATEVGLVRFDGVRFAVFDGAQHEDLARGSFGKLIVARDGTLWAGARQGRVVSYKDGRFKTWVIVEQPLDNHIRALCEDAAGNLWVGLPGAGLARLDKTKDGQVTIFTTKDGLADDYVMTVMEDRAGAIWVGTRGGASRLKDGRFTSYTEQQGLRHAWVNAFYEDRAGGFWFGSYGGGLHQFRDGRFTAYGEGAGVAFLWAIHEDREGNLWIGSEGGGLSRFRDGQFASTTSQGLLPDNTVRSLLEDAAGNLWLGTKRGQLIRVRDRRLNLYASSALETSKGQGSSLPDDYTQAVYENADGSLWIGTRGGLSLWQDQRWRTWTRADGLPHNSVTALYRDRAGALWIGTQGTGLCRYLNGKFTIFNQDELKNIGAIAEDCDGALWLGYNFGQAARFKDGQVTVFSEADGLPGEVRPVLVDRGCRVWLGTKEGLALYRQGGNGPNKKFTSYKTDAAGSKAVNALYEDQAGDLWIGLHNGGLARLANDRVTAYTATGRALQGTVIHILEDAAGNLWVASRARIYRIRREDLRAYEAGRRPSIISTFYDPAESLENNECTSNSRYLSAAPPAHRLLLPTVKGVLEIEPDKLTTAATPPPIFIEEAVVDNRAINAGATPQATTRHVLPPGNSGIEFHYTALDFAAPEKLKFKYRLEGFQPDWIEAGARRVAYYTNLPPGNYRFRVLAANENGVWNEAGAAFDFYLQPRFYQTWWFYALCLCTLGLLSYGLFRLRVRGVQRRYEALLAERLAERTRIAREIHDTLIQGVVAISAQLEAVAATMEESPSLAVTEAATRLERVRQLARASLQEARRSVWDLRPQALDGGDLPSALTRAARQLTEGRVDRVEVTGEPRQLPGVVETNILRICQEALANAMKHAGASRIDIALAYEAAAVRLRVRDDGRGFDPDAHTASSAHIGLLGMRERARQIRGRLSLQSQPGAGTEIILTVPV